MKVNRTQLISLVVVLICFLFYMGLFSKGPYQPDFQPHLNYFRYLAESFLEGRLNLENTPSKEDLVEFNHQFYAYWPPVPALVYMPLVAIFGTHLPDALINTLFAVLNVLLVMKICFAMNKQFNCSVKLNHLAFIGLFWGLGTVQFYMARSGTVWLVSQIMAQTFLLLSIYTFISITHQRKRLLIAGFFFACATYTRNHFLLAMPFFIGYELATDVNFKWKKIIHTYWLFLTPFLIFSILNAYYNYARFGDCFENGLKYHLMSDYFKPLYIKHGYFSFHYYFNNFYTEVLHWPTFQKDVPFLKKEPEGFGFIWGSPVYLFVIPAMILLVKHYAHLKVFKLVLACILSVLLMSTLIFCIMGTGWVQFCARYTLDFQFFIVLILLLMWPQLLKIRGIKVIACMLLIVSFAIQYIGAYYLS